MNIKEVWENKDFQGLPDIEKAKVVNYVLQRDPVFLQLPPVEQGKVRQFFIQKILHLTPTLRL